MYDTRFYRNWVTAHGLTGFEVRLKESDLYILAEKDLSEPALEQLKAVRAEIELYATRDTGFLNDLAPRKPLLDAPEIIRAMVRAGERWRVGPMAAIAGAVAEAVGKKISEKSGKVIVENGGDVFALSPDPVKFALYAGEESPFAGKVRFRVDASAGIGVCTSSGVVGPSYSLGRADAVVAISPCAADADAAATAIANRIHTPDDVGRVVEEEKNLSRLDGLIACKGDRIAFFGNLELVK